MTHPFLTFFDLQRKMRLSFLPLRIIKDDKVSIYNVPLPVAEYQGSEVADIDHVNACQELASPS